MHCYYKLTRWIHLHKKENISKANIYLPGELLEGAESTRPTVGLLQPAADSEMDPFIDDWRPSEFVVVTDGGSTIGDRGGPGRFAGVCILTCAIAYHCNKQRFMSKMP